MLEVSGAILERIDGRQIDAEAILNVRSYGGPFDRFHVRLPPRRAQRQRALGYTIVPADPWRPSAPSWRARPRRRRRPPRRPSSTWSKCV